MRHATDGALVRWVDRQLDAVEAAALRGHLAECPVCRGRLAALGRRSRLVSRALRRDGARRPNFQRWAAVAAAVLVVVVAVQPVRAWVAEGITAAWAALAGSRAPEPPASAASGDGGTVTFVPAAATFTLEIAATQAGGRLAIEFVSQEVASARISAGETAASLVVLPAGLRILNSPASRASYVLRLPARLTMVVVRVAGGPPLRLQPRPPGETWELDLAAPR
jgi:hypothetical protein